jgi:hypothetical protein
VSDVLANNPLCTEFRRTPSVNKWAIWILSVQRLMLVILSSDDDKFVRKLTTSRTLTFKSMYAYFMNGDTVHLKKKLEAQGTIKD